MEFLNVSRKHPLLKLQNYVFRMASSDKRYWICSKKISLGCPAKLRVDDNGDKIMSAELKHNHRPSLMNFTDFKYDFIQTPKRKRPLMVIDSHTFSQVTPPDKRYWHCTEPGCPAKIRFTDRMKPVCYSLDHRHEPPKYYKTENAQYVKVKPKAEIKTKTEI